MQTQVQLSKSTSNNPGINSDYTLVRTWAAFGRTDGEDGIAIVPVAAMRIFKGQGRNVNHFGAHLVAKGVLDNHEHQVSGVGGGANPAEAITKALDDAAIKVFNGFSTVEDLLEGIAACYGFNAVAIQSSEH